MNLENARKVAAEILYQVTEQSAYADIALDRVVRQHSLSALDRAFVTELVYGTVKHLRYLDYILSHLSAKPIDKLDAHVRNSCRLGLYQIFILEHVPDPVAVYETVEAAKTLVNKGARGFLNGLLRSAVRKKAEIVKPEFWPHGREYLGTVSSHPQWLVDRWINLWAEDQTKLLCAANNEVPPISLRTNTLRLNRKQLISKLEQVGIEGVGSPLTEVGVILRQGVAVSQLSVLQQGECQVQDVGSMLVAELVAPTPGDRLLDACSAPGGKTTHLAQLMEDQGEIIAADINRARLGLVVENCQRLGVSIVKTEIQDASLLFEREEWKNSFDKVLVDAPCTGTGVLRRRADSRWRKTPKDLVELPRLQKAIIDGAAQMVKKGGALVYSTCSIDPAENQEVIEWFLSRSPGWEVEDYRTYLKLPSTAGFYLGTQSDKNRSFLFLYPHREGTDGFFAARLRRTH